ncbi:MAG: bifunctional metallophosphatase/5'-nucleotidase [Phocaeicola sp.]
MKRIFAIWAVVFCMGSVLQAQNLKEIVIYHTNDLHSRIESMSVNDPDTIQAGRGGMARMAGLTNALREKNPQMLLFDCGDFSQGTPYYNLFKGELEIKLMNEIGYDAVAVGNHEFDFGLENMARIFRMANFPILCANYHFEGTVVEGLVKPYTTFMREGLKIGVFGLGTPLEGMVQEKLREGVRFESPVEAAQRVADYLKKNEKCDLVICISHLGWKGKGISDEILIGETRNIDVVLGGHSHSYFDHPLMYKNRDGIEVPLQQMGKNGIYLGELKVKIEKD